MLKKLTIVLGVAAVLALMVGIAWSKANNVSHAAHHKGAMFAKHGGEDGLHKAHNEGTPSHAACMHVHKQCHKQFCKGRRKPCADLPCGKRGGMGGGCNPGGG
jgi:hypothetical protein